MTPAPRYHFLDGLRGIAMLVGIFFHAAMSFMDYSGWWAQDVRADPASFGVMVDLVHASRMPLFFMVSGFFTAMMWKRRGVREVVKQRLLRIGVPLVVGTILMVPIMSELDEWSAAVKEERAAEETLQSGQGELENEEQVATSEEEVSWYWKGVFTPVFYHLWFLYYLLWLLAIFVPVAWLWQKTGKTMPDFLVKSPWCLIALAPLTFWAQLGMPFSYGPGTALGVLPWGPKLGYYAIFFFFGALAFGRGWWEEKAGTRWWLWFLAALPLFIVTRAWIYTNDHYYAQMGVSLLTWLLLIGLFGFFRRYLNGGHPVVRYLSDASYWLYLGHFPLIVALQILMQDWEISAWLKFSIIAFGVTGFLLVIYEYGVRYTWVGALLNGRKNELDGKVRSVTTIPA